MTMDRRDFLKGSLATAATAGSLMLLPGDARADYYIRSRVVGGATYVYLSDVAAYYGTQIQRRGDTVLLASRTRRLQVDVNKRRALINNLVLDLGLAIRDDRGTVLVGERDLTLQIDPILRSWSLPRQSVKRIVIDPGHGDQDSGAQGERHKEKVVVLQIANRLHAELRARGYEVVLTRSGDTFLELDDRPAVARRASADLFLSVHVNSAGSVNSAPEGIETFFATPVGLPHTAEANAQTQAVAGNRWDRLNTRLAYDVHRYLVGTTKATDRGLKRMRWRVLNTPPCPAVLLELGFLTNRQEERLLGSDAYQAKLAASIANGVVAYHHAVAATEA
jgi:N-acetylmuramoyl-L-alanine amidase